jgi:serine/threonine protein kinase
LNAALLIGEGAFATILLTELTQSEMAPRVASDPTLRFDKSAAARKLPAAVKLLRPKNYSSLYHAKLALLREVRIMSALWHPNLLYLLSSGNDDDNLPASLWTVTPYCGVSLHQIYSSLSGLMKWEIMVMVASAVVEMHKKGIVHRDIKCENITVARSKSAVWATLLDFGLSIEEATAKALWSNDFAGLRRPQLASAIVDLPGLSDATRTMQAIKGILSNPIATPEPSDPDVSHVIGQLQKHRSERPLFGTARCLSPEAWDGQYTCKSDVWAFGVVLLEIFQEKPIKSAESDSKHRKRRRLSIPRSVPDNLRNLIKNCCSERLEDRFSMDKVLSALYALGPDSFEPSVSQASPKPTGTSSSDEENAKLEQQLLSEYKGVLTVVSRTVEPIESPKLTLDSDHLFQLLKYGWCASSVKTDKSRL